MDGVSYLLVKKRERRKMSSISQNILMALTVTVNKYASSNVKAVRRNETKRDSLTADLKRRKLLFSSSSFIAAALTSSDQLLQKYLKKTEENKAKNDKERLEGYYKRNYKDYFEFVEGSIKGKTEAELTESEKRILEWLKANK